MFTDRDADNSYDESSSIQITLSGSGATCDSDTFNIKDGTITISKEGTYVLSGNLENGMIVIDAQDTAKIQLVLNGVTITNQTIPAIYVKSADKVFVTTASNSENTLTTSGTYESIDENNIDAVIFSKSDLTLNGYGKLTIHSDTGNGITSKDDLVLTSGTYTITAQKHGLEGKDSIRIANGTYTITSGKDGLHADNDEDTTKGFLYIADGTFTIHAKDDGIHASSSLTIDGGTIDIQESYEGIEGLSIDINGGTISVVSSDDGLNAAGRKDSSGTNGSSKDIFAVTDGAYISITGGTLTIKAEGDGIDSNGNLTISGGKTYVSGPTSGGNGSLDYNGTGTITGGIFIAAGSAGMAQNFDSSSTQGSILVNTQGSSSDAITLSDSNGKELLTWTPASSYSCVIISTPEITTGSTYKLTTGSTSTEITMDSLIYGSSNGMGGSNGGIRDFGGKMGDQKGKLPNKSGKPSQDHLPNTNRSEEDNSL
ncbi:hypothetical protein P261_01935 [Lachnospiraceae bacterium TWA4]|nr:hypothetical protein P261_01935 [Lachnospiraceae bacterium TWA4]